MTHRDDSEFSSIVESGDHFESVSVLSSGAAFVCENSFKYVTICSG